MKGGGGWVCIFKLHKCTYSISNVCNITQSPKGPFIMPTMYVPWILRPGENIVATGFSNCNATPKEFLVSIMAKFERAKNAIQECDCFWTLWNFQQNNSLLDNLFAISTNVLMCPQSEEGGMPNVNDPFEHGCAFQRIFPLHSSQSSKNALISGAWAKRDCFFCCSKTMSGPTTFTMWSPIFPT